MERDRIDGYFRLVDDLAIGCEPTLLVRRSGVGCGSDLGAVVMITLINSSTIQIVDRSLPKFSSLSIVRGRTLGYSYSLTGRTNVPVLQQARRLISLNKYSLRVLPRVLPPIYPDDNR